MIRSSAARSIGPPGKSLIVTLSGAGRLDPKPGHQVLELLCRHPTLLGRGRQCLGGFRWGGRARSTYLPRDCGRGTRYALKKWPEELDRNREDRGRVVLRRDLGDRLEIAQLKRARLGAQHTGRLGQRFRGLYLALGVDHLGPPLP